MFLPPLGTVLPIRSMHAYRVPRYACQGNHAFNMRYVHLRCNQSQQTRRCSESKAPGSLSNGDTSAAPWPLELLIAKARLQVSAKLVHTLHTNISDLLCLCTGYHAQFPPLVKLVQHREAFALEVAPLVDDPTSACVDLGAVLTLVAATANSGVEPSSVAARLEAYAASSQRLAADVCGAMDSTAPSCLTSPTRDNREVQLLKALGTVLGQQEGFQVDAVQACDPSHCFIDTVLQQHTGGPRALCRCTWSRGSSSSHMHMSWCPRAGW